jgi:2-polyprenyl-3-methyl-5-hydroxy-6-metoxy-1,4-benzoquinol methylase
LLKGQGAARVVGVDISEEMIDRAIALEAEAPLGIEYRREDVTQLKQIGSFELVTAVYLFPYASTEQTITLMAQAIYENLKPGGRFVSITLNPTLTETDLKRYPPYGVSFRAEAALQNGTAMKATINLPHSSFELSNFYWRQDMYESIFRQVGFQEITWRRMEVSEAGINALGEDYWQMFLTKPYSVILECHKRY